MFQMHQFLFKCFQNFPHQIVVFSFQKQYRQFIEPFLQIYTSENDLNLFRIAVLRKNNHMARNQHQ